jgi:hypothetical protein
MIPRPDGTARFFVHSGCRRSLSVLQVFKIRPERGTPPTDDAAMVSGADGSVFENDAVRLVVERDGAIRIRQPRTRCWLSAIPDVLLWALNVYEDGLQHGLVARVWNQPDE